MAVPVRVYIADTSPLLDKGLFERIYNSVSEARRIKTDRLRFDKDKRLSLGAEYLLMRALADFGIEYAGYAMLTGPQGKPYLSGCPVQFNLSHSENRVMCTVSAAELGCDVEMVRSVELRLARRFFAEDEFQLVSAYKNPADMFYRLWTLKESYIKCTGQGFSRPLNSFSVLPGPAECRMKQDFDVTLKEFDLNDGYKYAVCVKSQIGDIQYELIKTDVR